MGKITFKVYKEAIIKRYSTAKKEDASGILSMPTPAQLRDFCTIKCDHGYNSVDEEVMKAFFETKGDETLKRSIERCNIDKFKPIISFLKGEKDTENQTRVGLAAIIVDFKPRPYYVFLRDGKVDDNNEHQNKKSFNKENIVSDLKVEDRPVKGLYKRIGYFAIGILSLFSFGYVLKSFVSPEKQCMQWQKDQYVKVDCQGEINSLYSSSPIIPFVEDAVKLNKLKVCDTTTFFKGGKAVIWYCKVDGEPEFFDDSGFHPVTGKALRPVTDYIIGKYVKQK